MVQEIRIGDYTFKSTTDSKTITISDDKFAELIMEKELIRSLNRLRLKL